MRHYGRLDTWEDAVREALLPAATQWPDQGLPTIPTGG
jgi:predicted RNA polymerase sigma factor